MTTPNRETLSKLLFNLGEVLPCGRYEATPHGAVIRRDPNQLLSPETVCLLGPGSLELATHVAALLSALGEIETIESLERVTGRLILDQHHLEELESTTKGLEAAAGAVEAAMFTLSNLKLNLGFFLE